MVADGLVLTGFDGPTPQGGVWNDLPKPQSVGAFRPDVSGAFANAVDCAYGEAKTEDDIDRPHTGDQVRSLATARNVCLLYLAVPRSAAYRLDRVLARVALPRTTRIVRIHVPDCFVREAENDYA